MQKEIKIQAGDRFGCWTVLRAMGYKRLDGKVTAYSSKPWKGSYLFYRCRCECGAETDIRQEDLIANKLPTCQTCAKTEQLPKRAKKALEYVGQKFGLWTVIKPLGYRQGKDAQGNWIYSMTSSGAHSTAFMHWCRCECGKEQAISQHSLVTGKSKGCSPCVISAGMVNYHKHRHDHSPKRIAAKSELVGQQFGNWTVLQWLGYRMSDGQYAETSSPGARAGYYLCRCKCGVEKAVLRNNLINGGSTQCASCAHRSPNTKNDLVGQQFGDWTVLQWLGYKMPDGQFSEILTSDALSSDYYLCRCKCGTEQPVSRNSFMRGESSRCRSCAARDKSGSAKDKKTELVGQQFGNWTVLQWLGFRMPDGQYHEVSAPGARADYYLCRCKCGAEKSVSYSNLVQGKSTRCRSCWARQIGGTQESKAELVGQQFGDWTTLEWLGYRMPDGQYSDKSTHGYTTDYYLCRCKCGAEKPVRARNLLSGRSNRCNSCAHRENAEKRWKTRRAT